MLPKQKRDLAQVEDTLRTMAVLREPHNRHIQEAFLSFSQRMSQKMCSEEMAAAKEDLPRAVTLARLFAKAKPEYFLMQAPPLVSDHVWMQESFMQAVLKVGPSSRGWSALVVV